MKEVTIVSFILLANLFCLIATRPHNQKNSETNSVNYLQRLSPSEEFSDIKHVGGLDVDGNDNLVIFHRGSRKWTFDSFIGNEFNTKVYGPIEEDVISVINPNTYETILTTGSGRFYMPHGIHIDYDGNIWLTDVGLHQVFKFNPKNLDKPELTLGTKLESGSGVDHFCKPTGVAVSRTTGDIFISDGYCNRRIVQFDKDGKFVQEIVDKEQPLNLVHSVTLVESLNLVCAASREDGRIVCFDMISGDKKRTIKNPHMNTVYAAKFDPVNEVLHAVTGENRGEFATGISFDATATYFGKQIEIWKPKKITLDEAHDLTVSLDGSKIYTGQLNGEIDEFEFERKSADDTRE